MISSARSVYRMSETACACQEEDDVCTSVAGTGPATTLWAWPFPEGGYRVYALDNVVEPLGEPWVACSDLPEEPSCSCFGGANACP